MKVIMEEDGLRVTVEDIDEREGDTLDHPIEMISSCLRGIGYSDKAISERMV